MGGYLAPRAAAFENRIAACIADDGVISIYDAWIELLQAIRKDVENGNGAVVNAVVNTIMNFDIGAKWKITHVCQYLGLTLLSNWFKKFLNTLCTILHIK
jgi:hypothetical protein